MATELTAWTAALADGAGRAGHPRFAAALTSSTNTFFAHYADLFYPASVQGASNVRPADDEASFALAVLAEAIAVQLADERTPDERETLEQTAARVAPTDPPQGAGAFARRAIDVATTLNDIAYLRRAGRWISGLGLFGHLSQVGSYLDRRPLDPAVPAAGAVDVAVRARVHELVRQGPTVVVAHSLGTVVALEALQESGAEVLLLVTMGSPLAMRAIVRPRVRPHSSPALCWISSAQVQGGLGRPTLSLAHRHGHPDAPKHGSRSRVGPRLLSLVSQQRLRIPIEAEGTWDDISNIAQGLLDRKFTGKAVRHLRR